MTIAPIISKLLDANLRKGPEKALQEDVHRVLRGIFAVVLLEHSLCKRDRIDFFIPVMGLGIECKLARSGGSSAHVIRQLERYAEHDEVREIMLLTTSYYLRAAVPANVLGKPIHVVNIGGMF
jgi:hypothetical protein